MTIQRQILELIKGIQERTGTALLLITHDLGVVAETVDDIAVMYGGRVVETGTVEEVLLDPRHPYTRGLLESIPSTAKLGQRLSAIRGVVPNPFRMPVGCKFAPRCNYAWDTCTELEPNLITLGPSAHPAAGSMTTVQGAPRRPTTRRPPCRGDVVTVARRRARTGASRARPCCPSRSSRRTTRSAPGSCVASPGTCTPSTG